jgi:hypothetical protein
MTDEAVLNEPQLVGSLPKSRRAGRASNTFEPLLEQLRSYPDQWAALTDPDNPTEKANNIVGNLKNGIGAPQARYDRLTVEHMGETTEVPVPSDFAFTSVGTGEKVTYTKRDGSEGERTLGVVYACYLSDAHRDELVEDAREAGRRKIERRLNNGGS